MPPVKMEFSVLVEDLKEGFLKMLRVKD